MEFFLNEYGLTAVKLNCKWTVDQIEHELGIELDMDNKLSLLHAVQTHDNRVGLYNDNLLLTSNKVFSFYSSPLDTSATKFLKIFNKEITGAVYYNSVANLFGYSYFENGRRIRTKHGDMNNTWVNIGEELSIEKTSQSEDDINNWLIEKVTGGKLFSFAGKEIDMIKFNRF